MDPKASKCYTCKWGLCMLQENTAVIEAHLPLGGIPGILPEPQIESWSDEGGEVEEQNSPKKIIETRVCSLCYWNPTGKQMETPIINIATIKDCSRYEKRD